MDHIGNYFLKIHQKIFQKTLEKERFISVVKNITNIELKTNDFLIKNNVVKLKIFGPKRTKILSKSDSIIEELNINLKEIIIRLE